MNREMRFKTQSIVCLDWVWVRWSPQDLYFFRKKKAQSLIPFTRPALSARPKRTGAQVLQLRGPRRWAVDPVHLREAQRVCYGCGELLLFELWYHIELYAPTNSIRKLKLIGRGGQFTYTSTGPAQLGCKSAISLAWPFRESSQVYVKYCDHMVLKNWLQPSTTVSNDFFFVGQSKYWLTKRLSTMFFAWGKKNELLIKSHCDECDVICIPLVVVETIEGSFLHIVHAFHIPFGALQ